LTNTIALTATYVGSEGHFLQTDSLTGRGYWSDQLDPKYLFINSHLADTGTTATTVATDCANAAFGLTCPSLTTFTKSQPLSQALKPFPYQTVPDSFAYIGNANYHGVQVLLNMRAWHGLTVNANYTFSRAIDDGGTFRSGYAIPAGTIANNPTESFPADLIERGVSTSNQPQHFVLTSVFALPFGKSILGEQPLERSILGGFKLSGIYQAYSGSPLAITGSTCQTNPADQTCEPTLNPNFSGPARQNGKWGKGVTWANYNSTTAGGPTSSSAFVVPSLGSVNKAGTAIITPISGPSLDRLRLSFRCSIRRLRLPTPLATRRAPRRTTCMVPATTSWISPWCAASRCTSPRHPS